MDNFTERPWSGIFGRSGRSVVNTRTVENTDARSGGSLTVGVRSKSFVTEFNTASVSSGIPIDVNIHKRGITKVECVGRCSASCPTEPRNVVPTLCWCTSRTVARPPLEPPVLPALPPRAACRFTQAIDKKRNHRLLPVMLNLIPHLLSLPRDKTRGSESSSERRKSDDYQLTSLLA